MGIKSILFIFIFILLVVFAAVSCTKQTEKPPETETPDIEDIDQIQIITEVTIYYSSHSRGEASVGWPQGMAINTKTNILYITTDDNKRISVINLKDHSILSSISPPNMKAHGLAIDESLQKLYTCCEGYFGRVDLGSGEVEWEYYIGNSGPRWLAFNQNTGRLYAVDYENDLLITIKDEEILAKTSVGTDANADPRGVAIDQSKNLILVANYGNKSVSIVDGSTHSVIADIPVGLQPIAIAIDELNSMAYVSCQEDKTIHIIDIEDRSVVNTISLSDEPQGIAVNPNTNHLFVSLYDKDTVEVYDTVSMQMIESILVGDLPSTICVNTNTNRVYVFNQQIGTDQTVTVIQDVE